MFQKAPNLKVKAEHLLLRKAVKWNVRHADFVYSFGGRISEIIAKLGVQENRILLQSNGITHDWLVNAINTSGIRKFVFIGRFERRKGIEELNKALLELLWNKGLSFEFKFIGPIPEDRRLSDVRVNYYGEIREANEIQKILDDCDCLVCPSHSEGMPTVILEAMARGLAIIATKVGAVERMVRDNGILLEAPGVELIRDAIQSILMKESSVRIVSEEFTWEKIVERKIADFEMAIRKVKNR